MTLSHRQHLENHYKHGEIHFKSVVSMIKSLIKRLQIRRSVLINLIPPGRSPSFLSVDRYVKYIIDNFFHVNWLIECIINRLSMIIVPFLPFFFCLEQR